MGVLTAFNAIDAGRETGATRRDPGFLQEALEACYYKKARDSRRREANWRLAHHFAIMRKQLESLLFDPHSG
jgi:hypothetical protein